MERESRLLVWFIRHAESEGNAGLAVKDTALTPLTARGAAQARRLALVFSCQPSLLVLSPYQRAKETAQPTLERFPDTPQAVWPVQEFTYITRFRGQPTTAMQREPAIRAYWERCDPLYRDGEGAESFADLMQRVQATYDLLRQHDNRFIAIFTHGNFMRALYWALVTGSFAANSERMQQFNAVRLTLRLPNTAIIKLRIEPGAIWISPIITLHIAPAEASSQTSADTSETG